MKSILDPTFVYIPSACTDIRKTFARVRAEQAQQLQPQSTSSAVWYPEYPNVTICDIRTIPQP